MSPGATARGSGAGRPASTARGVALDVLERIDEGAYANLVLSGELGRSSLAQRDRALVTELVYGTTRLRRACDWMVDAHLHQPATDARVRAALRLGAYQLAFTRIPAHAAVAATVGEAPLRARGLVNAVLRRVSAGLPPVWPDLATELSYPDWIVDRLCADLGKEAARSALVQMNEAPVVTTRADGYVQDLGSQWVAELVGARPGERVADLCAAPGGKATAIAAQASGAGQATTIGATGAVGHVEGGPAGEGAETGGADQGHERRLLVFAGDVRPARARAMREGVRRLGLDRATGASANATSATSATSASGATVATVVADGRRPPIAPGSVDRVLVDAPCSGLGVLRRRPDARWRVQAPDVGRLAALQRDLLAGAAPLLRPGGTLAYCVCTLTRAETIAVDEWLSAEHPELVALPAPGAPWVSWGRGALLLPQAAGTDGMFLLRLTRKG
ncbi:MAG: transcription antitermination factor NusB [Acidimicrobiales bacterium]